MDMSCPAAQALRGPGPGRAAALQMGGLWGRQKRKQKVQYAEDDDDSDSQPSGRGRKKMKRRLMGGSERWDSGPMPDALKVDA